MPTPPIPDLWKLNEEKADAFYSMLLIRLAIKDKHERIIQVCRTIRRHAAKGLEGKQHYLPSCLNKMLSSNWASLSSL